ncbi:MAG TPA: secretin N-terminal domain-containing protein [Burkholderiales bacterium]|nr:secretin N-terminal domain-containing protein [Burkholderiales bacterium]
MTKSLMWIPAVLIFCSSFPLWAEPLELEVITLKYRTAQDVLPIVQPFVNQAGGTVTGTQNRLIVRTTRANLAEVRQILASIDTLPRRLMVTVKQDTGLSAIQRSAELSGNAAVGKAQVIVPPTGRDGRGLIVERQRSGNNVRAQVQSNESRENENNVQQLQVLEGNEAFIRVGQSVPVPQETIIQTPQGTQVIQNTQFRDVATGFYVRPRVSGEQVTLEVSPQRESLGPDGSVNTQSVSSVVSGRLGEWMELGGIVQSRTQQNSGIASRDSERNSDQRRIYIKVEEIR